MQNITEYTSNVRPHSIAGNKVRIITRHPETPHPKKNSNCSFKVYTFRSQDNTEAKVLDLTEESCMGDAATKKSADDQISGKKIVITSKDRKAISSPNKIPNSGTHNSNEIVTNDYTYCELHEEYHHILKRNDYLKLHSEKKEIVNKINSEALDS